MARLCVIFLAVIINWSIVPVTQAQSLLPLPLPLSAHRPSSYLQLPGWHKAYPFSSRNLSVEEALRLFAKNLRIGILVQDEVTGMIMQPPDRTLTRLNYLEELALEYDFVWYFDGKVLHISKIGEIETEIIPLSINNGAVITKLLQDLDIYQRKFIHRFDIRSRTFLVSGPTNYVELVKKAINAIENSERTEITLLRGSVNSLPAEINALVTDQSTLGEPSN